MLIPGRSFTGADYKYGFQGQEKDNELKGEGNSLNYTFRMHDPRVGRFFAIDPLTKKYPHYSPYSFSGNKVIASSELEGKEDLSIHVSNPVVPNGIGRAQIVIQMEYQVVTSGRGEVHNRNLINPANFTAAYDSGDTVLFSTNLPSPNNTANFLSDKGGLFRRSDEKLAFKAFHATDPIKKQKYMDKLAERGINSFYAIDVDYQYSLSINQNTTIQSGITWMSGNINGRGLFSVAEQSILRGIPAAVINANQNLYDSFELTNDEYGLHLSSDHGAAGLSAGIGANPIFDHNFISGSPLHFGSGTSYSFPLNATGVLVHEAGHNSATTNIHSNPNYQYTGAGTESNENPKPSKANTKNIINDPTNRQTF